MLAWLAILTLTLVMLVPVRDPIRMILLIVVAVVAVLVLLNGFGVGPPMRLRM